MSDERAATKFDLDLGAKIRARRLELEMGQEELGAKVGITFQQIQKYEKGANRVSASRLWDIARALGLPIGHFFPKQTGMKAQRIETVAAILGKDAGFEAAPGHDEGDLPITAMSKSVVRGGKTLPANPRAVAFVETATKIVEVLS